MNGHASQPGATLHAHLDTLGERERRIARFFKDRAHISRDVRQELAQKLTFGQKMADRVAHFGGSWTFIMLFAAVIAAWIVLNAYVLSSSPFDPYPYILLNLALSMLASIQAPIILMAQNRQAQADRLSAEHDYEVNLKAELEIMVLHDKLDLLRDKQWGDLISLQKEQLRLLSELIDGVKEGRFRAT